MTRPLEKQERMDAALRNRGNFLMLPTAADFPVCWRAERDSLTDCSCFPPV